MTLAETSEPLGWRRRSSFRTDFVFLGFGHLLLNPLKSLGLSVHALSTLITGPINLAFHLSRLNAPTDSNQMKSNGMAGAHA